MDEGGSCTVVKIASALILIIEKKITATHHIHQFPCPINSYEEEQVEPDMDVIHVCTFVTSLQPLRSVPSTAASQRSPTIIEPGQGDAPGHIRT
jgi:hypothetical protein